MIITKQWYNLYKGLTKNTCVYYQTAQFESQNDALFAAQQDALNSAYNTQLWYLIKLINEELSFWRIRGFDTSSTIFDDILSDFSSFILGKERFIEERKMNVDGVMKTTIVKEMIDIDFARGVEERIKRRYRNLLYDYVGYNAIECIH